MGSAMKFFIIYLMLVNLYGFFMMYSDKQKAKKSQWRTPEARIFLIAAIGGSIGVLMGMRTFRHKTKHAKFVYGIPLILMLQLYIVYRLFKHS